MITVFQRLIYAGSALMFLAFVCGLGLAFLR